MPDSSLPKDGYSQALRDCHGNPAAVEKTSMIDLNDMLGNAESWIVKTIRINGHDTVFLQRNNAAGGDRWVLPPDVTAAISRQRDSIVDVMNRRRAHTAAATRKAKARSSA